MGWRFVFRAVVGPFFGGIAVSGFTVAASPSDDPAIITVLHRDKVHLVSTTDGIYQASDADHAWQKLSTPAGMPQWGSLAQESGSSARLIYYTGSDFEVTPVEMRIPGSLYISEDGGKSWAATSIDAGHSVMDALAMSDGAIYAVTEFGDSTPNRPGHEWIQSEEGWRRFPHDHLIASRDSGKTWQDITPPITSAWELYGIFPDPDHPGSLCVRGRAKGPDMSPHLYQPADGSYQHWTEYQLMEWHGGHYMWEPSMIERPPPYNSEDIPATLHNYFKFPFPQMAQDPDPHDVFFKGRKN